MSEPEPTRGASTIRPGRPRDGVLLIGHSWTRAQVAHHLAITPEAVAAHPHLIRIDGPLCYDAAYPRVQFDEAGVRLDVAVVGLLARRRVPDDLVCDWLVRPHPRLGGASPLGWLDHAGSVQSVLEVLPEPTRPLPGRPRPDDTTGDQVASWVRRTEGSDPRDRAPWSDLRDRGGGIDAGPDVRELIESLQRGDSR